MINDNWFTWVIEELGIVTEGDNFDKLLINIKEAIECYYEVGDSNKQLIKDKRFYLSLDHFEHAY